MKKYYTHQDVRNEQFKRVNSTYNKETRSLLDSMQVSVQIDEAGWKFSEMKGYEKQKTNTYRITFFREGQGSKQPYSFDFHGSIHDAQIGLRPCVYDIIACLTWDCPNTYEDFCAEFGYDEDSRKGFEVWQACLKESQGLNKFFTSEEVEKLREIQ